MALLFQPRDRLLFIGDSITDCDRRGWSAPFGNGYVSITHNLLLARYPELQLSIVNKGISGNTVRDLAARWEQDVLAERPDWLLVKIGINDVWRRFGPTPQSAVPLPEYRDTLRRLVLQAREATSARLILLAPYMIEPDRQHPMRSAMDQYGATVSQLAAELQAPFVDTQAAFDDALRHSAPADWAADQIHPNQPGHTLIALALLRVAGFEL